MFPWLREELKHFNRDELTLLKVRYYKQLRAYKAFTTPEHIPDWVGQQQKELLHILMYIEERL